jgi:hypothetical protein
VSGSAENSWSNAVPNTIVDRVARWRSSDGSATGAATRGLLGVTAHAPGVDALVDGDAVLITVRAVDDDVDARAVRDAISMLGPLAPQTLVVVVAESSAATGIGRWFARSPRALSRAVVGSALLSEGLGDIGAGVDPRTRLEIVWARVRSE